VGVEVETTEYTLDAPPDELDGVDEALDSARATTFVIPPTDTTNSPGGMDEIL